MASKPKDFPLSEIATACEQLIADGAFILQKWTCEGCGLRLSGQHLNALMHNGHCQHCNHVTDINKRGCNYAVIRTSMPKTLVEMEQALGLAEAGIH